VQALGAQLASEAANQASAAGQQGKKGQGTGTKASQKRSSKAARRGAKAPEEEYDSMKAIGLEYYGHLPYTDPDRFYWEFIR
jgi:hypothetical protein